MTLLYYDKRFLEHQTPAFHPERPERVATAWQRLTASGLDKQCTLRSPTPLEPKGVEAAHSAAVVERAQKVCQEGGGHLDGDTPVSERSFETALLAAGTAANAVDAVLNGEDVNAFCLIRPPGHHATPTRSMGFCLFNNIALAARRALDKHDVTKILIVDWDVHHGNGTQDVFYEEPRVVFFSAHRYPFYPGTGAARETGRGKAQGHTFNMPVSFGTPREEYRKRFLDTLSRAADLIKPELVLLSAGFDAHHLDPIGSLGLETEDFVELSRMVLQVARTHAKQRLVSLLEGGYNLDALAESVEAHVKELLAEKQAAR